MKKNVNQIIKETIEEYIDNNAIFLFEFAHGKDEYLHSLKSLLHPIFDNLACIAIFHDLDNIDIIDHWANRAKTLPSKLMVEKIKSGKRENVVPIAFSTIFGEAYEDIDANWYAMLIKYYKDDNRDFKLVANDTPINYHTLYTPMIAQTMESLKTAFIEMNYETWSNAVNEYVKTITDR